MLNSDDIKQGAKRYIKSVAMDLIVVIVAISYVLYQMVKLEPTDTNPWILLAQSFMAIACGLIIKQSLGENGFSRGYNSPIWEDEEKLYNSACNTALPYMDKVSNYYQCEIIEGKRIYRIQHLQEARLRYIDWFDKNGNYIGTKEAYKKLDFRQKFVVRRCIKVKIYPLNLFSQYSVSIDQRTKKEITDKKQRLNNATKNTISAVLIAIIGVYFLPAFNERSWAAFIASTMQVSMWVLFGILQLYTNYNFVVQDKVSVLKTKKEEITKFTSKCVIGLYDKSPYDVEITVTYPIVKPTV